MAKAKVVKKVAKVAAKVVEETVKAEVKSGTAKVVEVLRGVFTKRGK